MTQALAVTTELAIGGNERRLISQMKQASKQIASMSESPATTAHQRAAIIEAAAKQAGASAVQLAAAELRLRAEHRIGRLLLAGQVADVGDLGLSHRQREEFKDIARIPRSWKIPMIDGERKVDLFEEALKQQLRVGQSQTTRAVYLKARRLSARRHSRYSWLYKVWDGAWFFYYDDPTTKRLRSATHSGSLESALEARAALAGRVSPQSTKMRPHREKDPLADVLDSVRQARESAAAAWGSLTEAQKRELDGLHGRLDDIAIAIVKAVNLH